MACLDSFSRLAHLGLQFHSACTTWSTEITSSLIQANKNQIEKLLTVSKLTLVLIEGLVKIIAIVFPVRGLKSCASFDLKMALTSWAVASTASSFSRDQSSTWRKWDPSAGGEMPAAEGGDSAAEVARAATTPGDDLLFDAAGRRRGAARCCLVVVVAVERGACVPCLRACILEKESEEEGDARARGEVLSRRRKNERTEVKKRTEI